MATAIASSHIRIRVQSPMLTMSDTAPIVQKFVMLPMKPNIAPSPNPSQTISVADGNASSMRSSRPLSYSPR